MLEHAMIGILEKLPHCNQINTNPLSPPKATKKSIPVDINTNKRLTDLQVPL